MEASGEGHLEEVNVKLTPKGLVGLAQGQSGRKSFLGRHIQRPPKTQTGKELSMY